MNASVLSIPVSLIREMVNETYSAVKDKFNVKPVSYNKVWTADQPATNIQAGLFFPKNFVIYGNFLLKVTVEQQAALQNDNLSYWEQYDGINSFLHESAAGNYDSYPSSTGGYNQDYIFRSEFPIMTNGFRFQFDDAMKIVNVNLAIDGFMIQFDESVGNQGTANYVLNLLTGKWS